MKEKKTEQKLTEKQENFALEYIMNGKDATAAYEKVYDSKTESKNSLYVSAHKVLHNSKVSIRIHQLEMEQYSKHILSIEERKILLTEWAKNGDGKAIEMLNKMEGVYIEKKQLELTGDIKTDNKWTIEFIEAKNEQSSDTEQTK